MAADEAETPFPFRTIAQRFHKSTYHIDACPCGCTVFENDNG
jgi:hypothetical protein